MTERGRAMEGAVRPVKTGPERELVLDMLLELEKGQEYGNLLIRSVLDKYDYLDGRQKAFIKRLTEGVLERRLQLDYILEQFSSVPVKKMKPLIRCLLRMGAYQILFMDNVPDSAACNEAVKLAGARHFQSLKGFVNGVLRALSRKKTQIQWPDRGKEPVRYLSVRYSMPEWIVRLWLDCYGTQTTEKMLAALLEERPLTIRLSEQSDTDARRSLLDRLEEAGCAPKAHPLLPYAFTLTGVEGVASLPGYAQGQFAVQDVSSMLVAEAAGFEQLRTEDKKELFVLDVCAAPGGKAVHAAQCLAGRGRVQARDISEYKTDRIRENAQRMRTKNLEIRVWDAAVPDGEMRNRADVLLADLPCSGLGVIGRKADIKYRATPESLRELAALQKRILSVVWEYVKPGGILVYSTCTVNSEENEETARWLAGNFPLEPVSLRGRLPEECLEKPEGYPGQSEKYPGEPKDVLAEACCQLLPGIHGTDGFFLSCFRRKEEL